MEIDCVGVAGWALVTTVGLPYIDTLSYPNGDGSAHGQFELVEVGQARFQHASTLALW